MENEIIYKQKTASESAIFSHLKECKNNFLPPLEDRVDINEYAKKIFDKAITFEAWKGNILIGLIATYFNMDNRSAFITNASVTKQHMGLGIASKLLQSCIEYASHNRFKELQLEVSNNNVPSINFHKKHNFIHSDTKGDIMIMKLELN